MRIRHLLTIVCMVLLSQISTAQVAKTDSTLASLSDKAIDKLSSKADKLASKLHKKSQKQLDKFERIEKKALRKIALKDSILGNSLLKESKEKYAAMKSRLRSGRLETLGLDNYLTKLDSLETGLACITKNFDISSNEKLASISNGIKSISSLKQSYKDAGSVGAFLKQQRNQLKQYSTKFGLDRQLKKLSKDYYYYGQMVADYKQVLNDPLKQQELVLKVIRKVPMFSEFFSKHSELASLFPNNGNIGTAAGLVGLQTTAMVRQGIQGQLQGASTAQINALQQQITQAQQELKQLKQKLSQMTSGNSEMEVPDFTPNSMRRKPFAKRLEYNANIQSTRNTPFWPTTSDIGLGLGFKLNDRSVIGLGASYKLGWGRDIRNIKITHEGLGLRSYIDWRLKGSFYLSGGYEQNYRQRIENISLLKQTDYWQQSGLLGLSKKIAVKKKMKTDIKLLFDFLYRQHVPETQPILFRVGYSF
ncbi:hypothetical protein [Paraflavitalea sp. sgz302552]|uniref:hypothetical protein n=1 Tax=Paraflavitalea sp. sgz302552 TaxID=3423908 RepID=UPI003D32BDAA